MKKITKDNKGITLIALIITIIVMLILVSAATYTGFDTYENTKVNHFVAQMQLIQAKVDEMTTEELNSLNLNEVTTESQKNAINSAFNNEEIKTNDTDEYKLQNIYNATIEKYGWDKTFAAIDNYMRSNCMDGFSANNFALWFSFYRCSEVEKIKNARIKSNKYR